MGIEIKRSGKPLSLFTLIMINVIAVDNLRSLTVGAEYGFAMVFFYSLAALIFFIPTILVTAELATGWPNTGGVYIWVREAFGPRWGFITIWMQWIYNVVWYPTVFTFMAGILAYLIHPELVNSKLYMLSFILTAFWIATGLNCLGLTIAGWVSTVGALIGTILPMVLIACLGFLWIYSGHSSQIIFSTHTFFPSLSHFSNIAFLTNILFGLMGMEMSAVHAGDVVNPKRDYPRALLISGLIILITLVSACLAITIVVPQNELNLVSGLLDAFKIFFQAYHMGWFMPVIALLIIIGSLCGASAWIIGPARGLYIACLDEDLPSFLKKINQRNMPVGILLSQGVIVTLLCAVFLIMPSVSSSYWILSNLTAQLALIFYILMFSAAIYLRYKYPKTERAFQIPGGKLGLWVVCGIGILTCFSAILLGFLPPAQIVVGKIARYETLLIIGIIVFCLPAFFLHPRKQKK